MMKPIHDRMPVILEPNDWELWLDRGIDESEALKPLLKPFDEKAMKAYEVSTFVNSPVNNTAQCIEPRSNALF
jgi:putative SOS response-associated peptidase YedK